MVEHRRVKKRVHWRCSICGSGHNAGTYAEQGTIMLNLPGIRGTGMAIEAKVCEDCAPTAKWG